MKKKTKENIKYEIERMFNIIASIILYLGALGGIKFLFAETSLYNWFVLIICIKIFMQVLKLFYVRY